MIFCQYSYKDFHNENKDKHPIQPYHWNNWIKMVNDNEKYCQKMNWLKWIECYFWVWTGRIRWSDLPSHHRYWKIQTNKDRKKSLIVLIGKYKLCKKDPGQIKYLFNATTSLKDIEKLIIEKRRAIF